MSSTKSQTKAATELPPTKQKKEDKPSIQCAVCKETKEIKILPCQHFVCHNCLHKIITRAASSKRSAGPICPTCKEPLKLAAAEYPVYVDRSGEESTTLGECKVVTVKWCYDVSSTPSGDVLVGRVGGFDICNAEGEITKSVASGTDAIVSIQHYNNKIYTVSLTGNNHQQAIEFDTTDYWESRRWSVSYVQYLSKLAISNDKVYVSDPHNKYLQVYNLSGEILKYIKHSTFEQPVYMHLIAPGLIIICDCKPANKVYKLDCKDDKVIWSCDIDNPVGICCDKNGDIWVWSDKTKTIFILCPDTGEVKQEIRHTKFAEVTHFNGILITDKDVLWAAAYDKGLLKFNIDYVTSNTG